MIDCELIYNIQTSGCLFFFLFQKLSGDREEDDDDKELNKKKMLHYIIFKARYQLPFFRWIVVHNILNLEGNILEL